MEAFIHVLIFIDDTDILKFKITLLKQYYSTLHSKSNNIRL